MTTTVLKLIYSLVLFSEEDNTWKIADFGFLSEGTSSMFQSTQDGRGTTGYRAPELLRETSVFNSKVDIWALGCILYELVFCKKAFSDDYEVTRLALFQKEILIPEVPSDELSPALVSIIYECLKLDCLRRPSTRELWRRFRGETDPCNVMTYVIPYEQPLYPAHIQMIVRSSSRGRSMNTLGRNHRRMVSYGINRRGNTYATNGIWYSYRNRDGSRFYDNGRGFSKLSRKPYFRRCNPLILREVDLAKFIHNPSYTSQ